MIRQIALDTETTGLSPQTGHRIIEIGGIEIIDRTKTGKRFHVYLNPERTIDEGAFRVHGIGYDFLKDKPRFQEIVDNFIDFIADAELIIHNAAFDIGFLEAELKRLNWPKPLSDYVSIFDTLTYARTKHRGAKNNLDALCKRYHIDNTHRTQHGALLDAEILASVYLAMTSGQMDLFADLKPNVISTTVKKMSRSDSKIPIIYATPEELAVHEAFMKSMSLS